MKVEKYIATVSGLKRMEWMSFWPLLTVVSSGGSAGFAGCEAPTTEAEGAVSIVLNNSFVEQHRRSLSENQKRVYGLRKTMETLELRTLHVVHVGRKFAMLVAMSTLVD